MPAIYDPFDPAYKSPFGAVVCGTKVMLRVCSGTENVSSCDLLLRHEFAGREETLAMAPAADGSWQL